MRVTVVTAIRNSLRAFNKIKPQSAMEWNSGENTAAVLLGRRNIAVQECPMPSLQPDGVLVEVISTGICGTDMHSYLSGGFGGQAITEPIVLGHESAGEVIAVGGMVTSHQVGDRVAIEPGLPCRRCRNCKDGRSNICLDLTYCGMPGSVGSLSRYFALPADMAPKIPASISWDEAGCIQPLAIGVQIGKRGDLRAHQNIAIFPIGLITAAIARAYSASEIIASDNSPERVEFARTYLSPLTGKPIINHVFLSEPLSTSSVGNEERQTTSGPGASAGDNDADKAEVPIGDRKWEWAERLAAGYLREAGIDKESLDRVVETTGVEDCLMLSVALAKQGGTVLAVGLGPHQTAAIPTIALNSKEIDFKGIMHYTPSCFPDAIDLLARGVVDLEPLISVSFPLSQAQDAFEAVASGKYLKVLIKNQE